MSDGHQQPGTLVDRWVERRFFKKLIKKTRNFGDVTWLGNPVWQNVLDLWTIQETIAAVRPARLIETGTNRGGSSLFYAHLLDLMGLAHDMGKILTIDIERLHTLAHPRITYLLGSSTAPEILQSVHAFAKDSPGPVMVILDSDHSRAHVRDELERYAPLVTPGSYLLCQDGVIDELPMFHKHGEEGPLLAVKDFLDSHPEFEVDHQRCGRFLISHHPMGWLRRKA
ncbi:MAG: cephalosporin hydroxylase [Phycisphaeraceae bacterium]|nr:MAG: cephalosporin hydroxylase [Phycisphaeraceae bacterium]